MPDNFLPKNKVPHILNAVLPQNYLAEVPLPANSFALLMLYDMQGRQLAGIQRADQTIGNYREVISMNSYPRGEYLLRITVGENQYGEKIIKY